MNGRRKEFRRNLANIHQKVYDRSFEAALDRIEKVDSPNGPMIPVEDHMVAMYEALDEAAEAVYAQALRDVLSMKQSGDWDDSEIVYVHDIESYAGYHGIDLTDREAK